MKKTKKILFTASILFFFISVSGAEESSFAAEPSQNSDRKAEDVRFGDYGSAGQVDAGQVAVGYRDDSAEGDACHVTVRDIGEAAEHDAGLFS